MSVQRPVIVATPWDGLRSRAIAEMKFAAALAAAQRPPTLADLKSR